MHALKSKYGLSIFITINLSAQKTNISKFFSTIGEYLIRVISEHINNTIQQ